jgi:hypothetical protein
MCVPVQGEKIFWNIFRMNCCYDLGVRPAFSLCYEQYNFMFHFYLSFDFHFIDIMFYYSCIFNLLIDGEAWPA